MGLKRNISKTNLLFLSISSIVGSGWLFGSFYTAQVAGPAAILSWFLGGFFIAIIALTLAELSTMFPLAGGSTTYASLSHGKFCGAMFSWVTWLWSMAVAPIEVQAVMQYASHYIPHIVDPITNDLTSNGFIIAIFLMFILCFINLVGVKLMSDANKYISLWKLAVPVGISIILLTYRPHYENLTSHSFSPYGFEGVFSAISTGGIAYSFFGFQTAVFLGGEAKNPQKSIPFALFGSLLLCTILYSLLQLGFIVGVHPSSLSGGWAGATFVGDSGPFAGLLLTLGIISVAKILYIDAVVSPLGTALGYVAASSRILYCMGLQEDAPKSVAKLNKHSIPWISILVNFGFGMLFFLPFAGWKEMASFLSAAIVISLICGPISLPIFREIFPEKRRPFVLPFAKSISFLAFYLCTLILYWTGFETILKFEVCFSAMLFIFAVMYFSNAKMRLLSYNFKSSLWIFVYLILCGTLSYFGTLGGGRGYINMKESLVAVFIICFIVNKIAEKTALSPFQMKIVYNNLLLGHKEQCDESDFVNERKVCS